MELLAKLGIDWRLLIAQAVNFGLLLGILTFFVYRPLLDVLDRRRMRIAKALEDARKMEEQNKQLDGIRQQRLRAIDVEAGALLQHAKTQAEKTKEETLLGAKREAEHILIRGRAQLEQERTEALADVQRSAARMILALTEKILRREFSQADQERILTSVQKDLPALLR